MLQLVCRGAVAWEGWQGEGWGGLGRAIGRAKVVDEGWGVLWGRGWGRTAPKRARQG